MYKTLTIGGKDYKLEYTIEAALYKDGVDRLIDFIGGFSGVQGEQEITKGLEPESKTKVRIQIVNNLKSEITNLPNTALELFYMGLLQHHGEDGDGTVPDIKAAKRLVAKYFAEQDKVENGINDFAALLAVCMEQMGEDGFFKRTGLEKIMAQSMNTKPNRAARRAAAKASGNKS